MKHLSLNLNGVRLALVATALATAACGANGFAEQPRTPATVSRESQTNNAGVPPENDESNNDAFQNDRFTSPQPAGVVLEATPATPTPAPNSPQ
ncbi:MAG: hypothetical protein IPK60_16235 [Sandaracinaceae bacterium]|nr:hypothetical protein [Sandaracinaceae bacterium]